MPKRMKKGRQKNAQHNTDWILGTEPESNEKEVEQICPTSFYTCTKQRRFLVADAPSE
jgi:hypothetical protein